MPTKISISVDTSAADQLLEQVEERTLKGMALLFRGPIHQLISKFFEKQFESEGAYGGSLWNPLSPVTMALKARSHRERMGTLRFTNRLWASLVFDSGPDQFVEITNDSYTRGTRVPYASFHQEGWTATSIFGITRKTPRFIPPRTLVPDDLPEAEHAQIAAIIDRYIETGVVP